MTWNSRLIGRVQYIRNNHGTAGGHVHCESKRPCVNETPSCEVEYLTLAIVSTLSAWVRITLPLDPSWMTPKASDLVVTVVSEAVV